MFWNGHAVGVGLALDWDVYPVTMQAGLAFVIGLALAAALSSHGVERWKIQTLTALQVNDCAKRNREQG